MEAIKQRFIRIIYFWKHAVFTNVKNLTGLFAWNWKVTWYYSQGLESVVQLFFSRFLDYSLISFFILNL